MVGLWHCFTNSPQKWEWVIKWRPYSMGLATTQRYHLCFVWFSWKRGSTDSNWRLRFYKMRKMFISIVFQMEMGPNQWNYHILGRYTSSNQLFEGTIRVPGSIGAAPCRRKIAAPFWVKRLWNRGQIGLSENSERNRQIWLLINVNHGRGISWYITG